MNSFPFSYHDYQHLSDRWKILGSEIGAKTSKFATHDQMPLLRFSNNAEDGARMDFYLSAGIHGDEPAGCWALLNWAENNLSWLYERSFLIYPCLNPWGFANNCRTDASGVDLNRVWNDSNHSMIGGIINDLHGRRFSITLNLHEDFDARGIYLYEPDSSAKEDGLAEAILGAAEQIIPLDDRPNIEGRKAIGGVIHPSEPPDDGIPEAWFLHQATESRNFTLETPSEWAAPLRIEAHGRMIEEALRFLAR